MTSASPLLLRNALIADVDRGDAFRGDIVVADGRIAEVARRSIEAGEGVAVRDCSGFLIIPGLVNAHTHGHGSLGKGLGDLWTLELLLNASSWASGGLSDEDRQVAATLNGAEMILKGCTATYDLFAQIPELSANALQAAVAGYADLGIRLVLAPMMADRAFYDAVPGLRAALPNDLKARLGPDRSTPAKTQLEILNAWLEAWPCRYDRARPALAPTIPTHCTRAFLEGCRDLARDHGIGIQMHLAESKPQAVASYELFGKSLTAYLDELGILRPGFTGAHCVWVDDDDIRRLADAGASIAHNPGSNLRLGSGVAPARRMLDAGLTVGIGSDGSVSSDSQNMFEAMRLASYASRAASPDPGDWISAPEALRMATCGGAAVLGLDAKIGRIASGYRADLVFLDLRDISLVPLNDAVRQLVQCADSSAVDTVMIEGEPVLESGRFTGIDYDALCARAQDIAGRLREQTGAQRALADALEPVVARHCVGLARTPLHIQRYCGC